MSQATEIRAVSKSAAGDHVQGEKWATFWLAEEIFALRVEDVQEVLMQQPLTPVPLAPEHVVGLLNLRGQIMPAIDLRRRLQLPERGEAGWFLLVLKSEDRSFAVVVDQIGDVLELPVADWRPPPPTLAAAHRSFVFAICPSESHVVLGLRVERLSDEDAALRGGQPS